MPGMERPARPGWREVVSAGLAFLALTATYLRLTPERWLGAITPDAGDPLFNLALLRWGADRIAHGLSDFWSPTFFYPLRGVLALSDHLAGPALFAAGLEALGLTPASVYDTLLLVALAGSALSCYLVLRWSGLSAWGAGLAAIAWSYSSFRWSALSHLQVLLALWVPPTLWAFDRLLAAPTAGRAVLFTLVYAAHLSGGSYLAYMIHFALATLLVVRWRHGCFAGLRREAWRSLIGSSIVCGALIAVLFGPYLTLGKRWGLAPTLAELAGSMVTLRSYATVGARSAYAGLAPAPLLGDPALWFGVVPSLLAGVGLWAWIRRRRGPQGGWAPGDRALVALACAAALVALLVADLRLGWGGMASRPEVRSAMRAFRGSTAVVLLSSLLAYTVWRRQPRGEPQAREEQEIWWRGLLAVGLVTGVLSHVAAFVVLRGAIPGLEAIRVPARFFTFTSLAMAACAGYGLDAARARLRGRSARHAMALVAVALGAVVLESAPRAKLIRWIEIPAPSELPPVYRWLAEQREVKAIVELPMLAYWREAERMYFWSIHRRPIVNGYSAYLPRAYERLRSELLDFPGPEVSERLQKLGVTHIVIHVEQLSRRDRRAWQAWHDAMERSPAPWLERVHEAGWTMTYRITRTQR